MTKIWYKLHNFDNAKSVVHILVKLVQTNPFHMVYTKFLNYCGCRNYKQRTFFAGRLFRVFDMGQNDCNLSVKTITKQQNKFWICRLVVTLCSLIYGFLGVDITFFGIGQFLIVSFLYCLTQMPAVLYGRYWKQRVWGCTVDCRL